MDEKIEKAIEPLLKMYEKIENDLLKIIASHFSLNEEFLNSDYWRIKKLEEMGLFNQEIVKYLAESTNKTEDEILKEFNKIGIDTIDMPKLESLFEDGVLKINPMVLKDNYTINNIIKLAYNELFGQFIELSQKIEKSTRNAYLNIVEEAYLKTTMGTHSYQEAIRESINDLSNSGITTLTYKTTDENGNIVGIRNYDIEGTVRREVLTSARKLSNDISMEVANELESEFVYLSEHLQCRPQHFDWQGTIIKRTDLIKVTRYGEIDGLAGINCRHYFEAYFGDARDSELKRFNKEECEKAYALSQHQRYLERGVRKWKRKAEMFKASDDNESYAKCKGKVKEWQLRVKDFAEENDLKRDFTKEYTINYNTSEVRIPNEEKTEVLIVKPELYKDLTQQLKNMKGNPNPIERRLNYSIDSDGNKRYDCFFEDDKELIDELECQKKLEEITGYKVYLNPKTYTQNKKTPDFWIKDTNELWDLKGIDGNAKEIIDNILNKACKSMQSENLILKQRDTIHEIEYLKSKLKYVFDNNHRKKIKQVILFDRNNNVIVYYKR